VTRKHFRALAECLKVTNANANTIEAIAVYLRTENPNFDTQKFLTASGYKP
jgi:hypothetical protein